MCRYPIFIAICMLALAGCTNPQNPAPSSEAVPATPPEVAHFDGLPLAGTGEEAQSYGFTLCRPNGDRITCSMDYVQRRSRSLMGYPLESISVDLEPLKKGEALGNPSAPYRDLHFNGIDYELSNRDDCITKNGTIIPREVPKLRPGQLPACHDGESDKYLLSHQIMMAGWTAVRTLYMEGPSRHNALIYAEWWSATSPIVFVTGDLPSVTVRESKFNSADRAKEITRAMQGE